MAKQTHTLNDWDTWMTCETLCKRKQKTRRFRICKVQFGESSALPRKMYCLHHPYCRRVGEAGNQRMLDASSSQYLCFTHSSTSSVLRTQPLPLQHCDACALSYGAVFPCLRNTPGSGVYTDCISIVPHVITWTCNIFPQLVTLQSCFFTNTSKHNGFIHYSCLMACVSLLHYCPPLQWKHLPFAVTSP
jgi:hypothetical protein